MPPKLHFQSGARREVADDWCGATLRPNFACARLSAPWPFPTKGSVRVHPLNPRRLHLPATTPNLVHQLFQCAPHAGVDSSAWNSGEALRSASSRKRAPNTASSSPLASEQVGRINRHSQRTWLPSANETLHTPRPSNPMLASAMRQVAHGLNQRGRLAVILGLQDACDGSGQPEAFHQIPPTLQFLTLNPINSKPYKPYTLLYPKP